MSIWFVILIAAAILISLIPKGKWGELMVTSMKKVFLDADTYIDVNNVTLQMASGTTQIDHVIVSKFGIFVVETKNMSGWIFGTADQAQWTQSLPGGKKFRFQNPLRQNYKHTKSLEEFLGVGSETIHSLVMFVGDAKFKTAMPENVLDCGYVSYIKAKTKVLFTDDEVAEMVSKIRSGMLPKSVGTDRQHIESLAARHGSTSVCPKCGGDLVVRTSRREPTIGRPFYGCGNYPMCRYKRPIHPISTLSSGVQK